MARKRKEKKPEEGAPAWMVTYGDMMTLLLCFFVMIVAMSEIKEDEQRYQDVVESIRKVFGYKGGIGSVPTRISPDVSQRMRKRAPAGENIDLRVGMANEELMRGRNDEVRTVREGRRFVVGGTTAFEPGRAKLLPAGRGDLTAIADRIRGLTHKVDVCGHASKAPLPADSAYEDHLALSLARARAVRDWLVGASGDRGRVDPRRVRVVGCGRHETVVDRAYLPEEQAKNDRVDIILTEAVVQDFADGDEDEPATARNEAERY